MLSASSVDSTSGGSCSCIVVAACCPGVGEALDELVVSKDDMSSSNCARDEGLVEVISDTGVYHIVVRTRASVE